MQREGGWGITGCDAGMCRVSGGSRHSPAHTFPWTAITLAWGYHRIIIIIITRQGGLVL